MFILIKLLEWLYVYYDYDYTMCVVAVLSPVVDCYFIHPTISLIFLANSPGFSSTHHLLSRVQK